MEKQVRVKIYIIFILGLLTACSKSTIETDKKLIDVSKSKDKATVVVQVSGTEEGDQSSLKLHSKADKELIQVKNSSENSLSEIDTRIRIETDERAGREVAQNSQTANARARSALKAGVPMESGILYQLIIYKVSTNAMIANLSMRSGDALQIVMDGGETYKWIAYSCNTKVLADLPVVTNFQNPTVSMGMNKDFLYDSGTITPNAYQINPLNITFKHKLARIGLEVNSKGMFADISSVNLSTSAQMKTGNINLLTGNFVGTLSSYTGTLSSFQQVAGYAFNDRKAAYLYTADTTAFNWVSLLSSVSLNLDNYAVTNGQGTRTFSIGITYTSNNFKPVLGRSKSMVIELVESPIETNANGIRVKWARSNLYYAGATDHNPYRFSSLNERTQNFNSFFAFGTLVPEQFPKTWNYIDDPCRRVFPIGTWRLPTEAEYKSLTSLTPTVVAGEYIEYSATGIIAPYSSNKLRFNMNGLLLNSGAATSAKITPNAVDYGSKIHLWTGDQKSASGPFTPVSFTNSSGTPNVFTESALLNSPIPGYMNGAIVRQSNFKNIRCVRSY